jgi:hypothetical protein
VAPRIRSLRVRAVTVLFRLSERARLRAEIRRAGTPVPVRTMRVTGRSGRNEIPFRIRGLPRARYRLTLTAVDAVGNVSKAERALFTAGR